jgi:DeoR family fructose operon transcriptional repressor
LEPRENLTVLTNALNVAVETTKKKISTTIFGGIIRPSTQYIIGPDTIGMVQQHNADIAFLGLGAISIANGLMAPNRLEADVKKELIKIANKIVIVADSSKIDKLAMYSFGTVQDMTTFITDENADPEFLNKLETMNIEILIAEEVV